MTERRSLSRECDLEELADHPEHLLPIVGGAADPHFSHRDLVLEPNRRVVTPLATTETSSLSHAVEELAQVLKRTRVEDPRRDDLSEELLANAVHPAKHELRQSLDEPVVHVDGLALAAESERDLERCHAAHGVDLARVLHGKGQVGRLDFSRRDVEGSELVLAVDVLNRVEFVAQLSRDLSSDADQLEQLVEHLVNADVHSGSDLDLMRRELDVEELGQLRMLSCDLLDQLRDLAMDLVEAAVLGKTTHDEFELAPHSTRVVPVPGVHSPTPVDEGTPGETPLEVAHLVEGTPLCLEHLIDSLLGSIRLEDLESGEKRRLFEHGIDPCAEEKTKKERAVSPRQMLLD